MNTQTKNLLPRCIVLFLIIITEGCSTPAMETLTPMEVSWTLIAQYPTETPAACKSGTLWAKEVNDFGTELGITESIWFKETNYPGYEFGWSLEEEYGVYYLFYSDDEDGCVTKAEGGIIISDFGNDEAINLGRFITIAVPYFFDDTFTYNPYTEEAKGETNQFLDKAVLNCSPGEEYSANFVDSSGNTWTLKCDYYQEEPLLAVQYISK